MKNKKSEKTKRSFQQKLLINGRRNDGRNERLYERTNELTRVKL